jgi:hypothetical protein
MIELARGLSPGDLRELVKLETRVIASDGGRLKLEWGVLRARKGQDVEDVLCGGRKTGSWALWVSMPSEHPPSRSPGWSILPLGVAGSRRRCLRLDCRSVASAGTSGRCS